jgi:outer membrane biosynthesis protein TonB
VPYPSRLFREGWEARPELNAEALAQVRQWSFTPAMCDTHPDAHEVELTVHFQGR